MDKTDIRIPTDEELTAYMEESAVSANGAYEQSPVVLMVDDAAIGTLGNFSASIGDTCVFFFLNTYDDVSSANVIKIISESTDGAINFIWIPSCFKLNTGGFYFTLMKQVFYVYRNSHLDILI